MIVRHNISALNTLNKLHKANNQQSNSMKKLSSGLKINVAADDAAGLSISEKMRGQIRGLAQAQRNVQDGVSLLQTAEGGLGEISNPNLQRLRELAVQAANDTLTDTDRLYIQQEVEQIKKGINDIANNTEFNNINLLNIDGPKVTEVTNQIEVTINPGQQLVAGYINIPADNSTPLEVNAFFGTISGADWPDMNIVSPTGTMFGYSGTMGGSGPQTIGPTDSASSATYNGFSASDEKMTFTDPIPGMWTIEIRHTGGSNQSTFSLTSSHGIQLTAGQSMTLLVHDDKLSFHTGANSSNNVKVKLTDARTTSLGINDLDMTTRTNAEQAILKIDSAIETVSGERSKYGAFQNALEHINNNLSNTEINVTASESRIRDVDMAKVTMEQTKNSILSQAAQTMLVQANQQPQGVLQLLK